MDLFYGDNGCSLLGGNDAWNKRNQYTEEEDLTNRREWANRGPGALLPLEHWSFILAIGSTWILTVKELDYRTREGGK